MTYVSSHILSLYCGLDLFNDLMRGHSKGNVCDLLHMSSGGSQRRHTSLRKDVIVKKSELSRKHKCYGKTVFFVNTEQLVSFVLGFHFGFDLL